MISKDQILDALKTLDVKNDDHWTGDGLPRMDKMGIAGLKRGDITAAAPQFTRENPTFEVADPDAGKPDPEQKPDTDLDADKPDDLDAGKQDPTLETQEEQVHDDPDAELVAAHQKALDAVNEAQKVRDEAQIDLHKKQEIADRLGAQVDGLASTRSTQDDITDYLASQNAMRHQRAQQHKAMMAQFGVAQPVKSKLDQSMQRKTGYGNQRPARGMVVTGKE